MYAHRPLDTTALEYPNTSTTKKREKNVRTYPSSQRLFYYFPLFFVRRVLFRDYEDDGEKVRR